MEQRSAPVEPLPDPALWVDHFGDYLFRYALGRLRDRDAAEDLVQETFLAALRARGRFAGRSSPRTWLVGILKHKLLDAVRRRAADPGPDAAADALFDRKGMWRVRPEEWGGDPRAALETEEFWAAFHVCLGRLPVRLADAFTLRELEGLAAEQVCAALDVSRGNLWVLMHRARLALWRCLDANWFRRPTGEGRP